MAEMHPDITAVLARDSEGCIVQGNCLKLMADMPAGSVDLVFGSPPYEDCRTYGIDFALKGQDWVDWMVEIVTAALRVSRGLVCFVVAGKTEQYRYSATPELLMADLHRAGIHLRRPPIFHRVGIPGSGGPDWWRSDYEICICATNGGELPWSDNTATGKPCTHKTGGALSYRTTDGDRINAEKHADGSGKPNNRSQARPDLANPGNLIHVAVGGGQMGSSLAHKNEAPFPEDLVKPFVLSFCPPGGIVLDPFSGSGTTAAVAKKNDRRYIAVDVRESQIEIARNRVRDTERPLF